QEEDGGEPAVPFGGAPPDGGQSQPDQAADRGARQRPGAGLRRGGAGAAPALSLTSSRNPAGTPRAPSRGCRGGPPRTACGAPPRPGGISSAARPRPAARRPG